MSEARRVENMVASVLKAWLRSHGYPVVAEDQLVPIGWLRTELDSLLAAPLTTGRSTPRTAWRAALVAVQELLYRYEFEIDDLRTEEHAASTDPESGDTADNREED